MCAFVRYPRRLCVVTTLEAQGLILEGDTDRQHRRREARDAAHPPVGLGRSGRAEQIYIVIEAFVAITPSKASQKVLFATI